jgi:hypothetical protein
MGRDGKRQHRLAGLEMRTNRIAPTAFDGMLIS